MKLINLFITTFSLLLMISTLLNGQDVGLTVVQGNGVQNNQGGIAIIGTPTGFHLALDSDDIQSKSTGTNYARLDLNYYGGDVRVGDGVFFVDRINNRVGINNTAPDGPLDIDFGSTGSLIAGTPVGEGPGWIHYAPNGNRWNANASNHGFVILAHFNNNRLQFTNDGKLGINTNPPGKFIDIFAGTPAVNEGLRVLHTSGYGAALLANNGNVGGWFVTDGGSNYAPIWAHSFNVLISPSSFIRNQAIVNADMEPWLNRFDKLEVAFTSDASGNRESTHFGIIAETLPPELVSFSPKNPNGSDEQIMTVNLADWTGLNTVIIKHLREENKILKDEMKAMKNEIEELKEIFFNKNN